MTISDLFSRHHTDCDNWYATAENAVIAGKWDEGATAYGRFKNELERHLATEEEVLFPAFDDKTGGGGPTQVMRMEHGQMRELLGALTGAVKAKDPSAFRGAGETLLVLIQQHNFKEEHILYPMCDQALAGDAGLISALQDRLSQAR